MYTEITVKAEFYESNRHGFGYHVYYNDSKLISVENKPLISAIEDALDVLLAIQYRRKEQTVLTIDLRNIAHNKEWLRTHICNRYATEQVFANITIL